MLKSGKCLDFFTFLKLHSEVCLPDFDRLPGCNDAYNDFGSGIIVKVCLNGISFNLSIINKTNKGEWIMSSVDNNNLMQLAIVVKDIDKVAAAYGKLFNLEVPEIRTISDEDRTPVYYKGNLVHFKARIVTFVMGPVRLELTESISGNSAWQDFIEQYGVGVHHVGFIVNDLDGAMNAFKEIGIEPLHVGYFENASYTFMDSIDKLGVRINIKHNNEDNKALIEKIYDK